MTFALLAIDTATEQCSVAIRTASSCLERVVPTTRGHADMVLSLVDEVLRESALTLSQLDGFAFGRGPGSFTGVRIAVGVIQGLSFATGLPVVGVSNLAAVAQRSATERALEAGNRVLVCMDARMGEAYCALYEVQDNGLVGLVGAESVAAPNTVQIDPGLVTVAAGTGFRAYPLLRERYSAVPMDDGVLPRAREIALLASVDIQTGKGVCASQAQPVYLRDQVAWPQTK